MCKGRALEFVRKSSKSTSRTLGRMSHAACMAPLLPLPRTVLLLCGQPHEASGPGSISTSSFRVRVSGSG